MFVFRIVTLVIDCGLKVKLDCTFVQSLTKTVLSFFFLKKLNKTEFLCSDTLLRGKL